MSTKGPLDTEHQRWCLLEYMKGEGVARDAGRPTTLYYML
jgi:hypothetical protein